MLCPKGDGGGCVREGESVSSDDGGSAERREPVSCPLNLEVSSLYTFSTYLFLQFPHPKWHGIYGHMSPSATVYVLCCADGIHGSGLSILGLCIYVTF